MSAQDDRIPDQPVDLTRLCGDAMGLTVICSPTQVRYVTVSAGGIEAYHPYDPLHDDAQAMALVKRFGLCINRKLALSASQPVMWLVHSLGEHPGLTVDEWDAVQAKSIDLNRAIVECVAKMQASKS